MDKKIKVDASFWKDSIDKSYKKLVPEDNKDTFVDNLIENIQKNKEASAGSAGADNVVNFKKEESIKRQPRSKRKTYKTVFATAACAAICGIGIMGGFMEIWGPQIQSTTPGIQSTSTQNDYSKTTEENVITPPKESTKYEQNDIKNIKKGEILLTGGEQKENYTNPTKIALDAKNIKKDTCKWTIKNSENDKQLYKGTKRAITTELVKMQNEQQYGKYIVTYVYKDNDGNQITLHKGFVLEPIVNTP